MPTFTSTGLETLGEAVMTALGTPPDLAAIVSHSLVEANLVGHDSHGVIRLMQYADAVRAGQVKPEARPFVVRSEAAMAVVDGAYGWGQAAAHLGTQTAIAIAAKSGLSGITITRCNHVGRLGEYAENVARAGMIAIVMSNVGAAVAPFGGRTRMLGTNPMAYAVPRGDGRDPVLVDFATSGIAEGKLRVSRSKGEQVPLGLIVDKDGNPSTNPEDFYEGGALLPFGGHKGYSLSVMCELIGGALSGMAPSCLPEFGNGNGTLLIAVNIPAFIAADQFARQTEDFAERIKSAPTAPGVKEILLPGDPESMTRRQRRERGIAVPDTTWREIVELANALGVADRLPQGTEAK